jgi:hypothetical protein
MSAQALNPNERTNAMSNPEPVTDPSQLPGDEPDEDEDEDTEENGNEEAAEPAPPPAGRNFVDVPEGYATLVGFSHILAKKEPEGRFVKVKSQVLYSTAKNTKTFPLEKNADGRWMVNIEKGLQWWDEKEQRKAERLVEAQKQLEADQAKEAEAANAEEPAEA